MSLRLQHGTACIGASLRSDLQSAWSLMDVLAHNRMKIMDREEKWTDMLQRRAVSFPYRPPHLLTTSHQHAAVSLPPILPAATPRNVFRAT